ncbi:MAG: multidrug efflux pump subunit AcrA (membrane-fusion protein) [Chitinophagales bacterium]|jgi:multidrug efflux pump subunit AcrA (membrane-fusion protein)
MKKNKTLRFIASIVMAILLLALTFFLASKISAGKKIPEAEIGKVVKTVFVDTVENRSLNLNMQANGTLEAYRKVDLYAEVQGILKTDGMLFKEGQYYAGGSTILNIDNTEFNASLVAQRSVLFNQLMSAMPDLQLDYPAIYPKWQDYVNNFDVNRSLNPLPAFTTDQEKYFINSRNIVNSYYNIKNLEERLNKYFITAPFSGVVTEALVNNGTLIRAGQKLGAFIDPNQLELTISLSESFKDLVQVGNTVQLSNLEGSQSYSGKVSRINKVVDPSTQSIEVFISTNAKGLTDGMYLKAMLAGKQVSDVCELPRELLIDNKEIFIVTDGQLKKVAVDVIHFTEKTAIIKGLPDGTLLLNKNIPGAYDGMLVEIGNTNK